MHPRCAGTGSLRESKHEERSGEPPPLLVWYPFLFMNLLSQALENPDRWSSKTFEEWRKVEMKFPIMSILYPIPLNCSSWNGSHRHALKMMPVSSPLCSKTFSGFHLAQSKSHSPAIQGLQSCPPPLWFQPLTPSLASPHHTLLCVDPRICPWGSHIWPLFTLPSLCELRHSGLSLMQPVCLCKQQTLLLDSPSPCFTFISTYHHLM